MSYSFNAKGILASRLLWLDHLDNALLFVYQSKQQLLRRISFKSRVVSCGVIYSFLEVEKHKNSYMILRYTTTKSLRLTVKKKVSFVFVTQLRSDSLARSCSSSRQMAFWEKISFGGSWYHCTYQFGRNFCVLQMLFYTQTLFLPRSLILSWFSPMETIVNMSICWWKNMLLFQNFC